MLGELRGRPKMAHTARRAPAQTGQITLRDRDVVFREEELFDFNYDEENDLFSFKDDQFAFSRIHADLKLLEERDYEA